MKDVDTYLDLLMHQNSFIDKVLSEPNLSSKDKQDIINSRVNRINSLNDHIDTVNYFNTLEHPLNEKPKYRGTDERFDFKQLEEDRLKSKYNTPSNPYIRKGMGVLNIINDFAPPVAIAKAADTITDQVSKGQYGEAAKTLGWELAMTNPAARLAGKAGKGVLSITNNKNKFGRKPHADNLITDQARKHGYDVPSETEYLYRGQLQEGPFKKGDVYFGAEPIVAGDYGSKIYAIPYDPKKFDTDKYLSPELINNASLYPNAHGQPQWKIPDDVVANLQKESGMPTMIIDKDLMPGLNTPDMVSKIPADRIIPKIKVSK